MKYSCRARRFRSEQDYELSAEGLVCRTKSGATSLLFRDIASIVVFKEKMFGSSRAYWACTIRGSTGMLRLTSAHRVKLASIEDRTATYIPFIKEFESRALAANPRIGFVDDEFRETVVTRIFGRLSLLTLAFLRLLTRRHAASVCGNLLSRIGVLLRGNRNARAQLFLALPGLSQEEGKRILRGMWDSIGRTFGEYSHVEDLMDITPREPGRGTVIMADHTAEDVRKMGSDTHGALMFAAHLGNWEIPAMAAHAAGRTIALVYKRQPSSALTEQLIQFRSRFAARLLEAGPSTPRDVLKLLRDGWLVGMLVDQHYAGGVEVTFFNRRCVVNPILARLARTQNWPVYGARTVRLPDQRHRFELVGPLEFPRDAAGRIDAQGAMQTVMGIVEGWIRENPEQWMWVHRLLR